MQTIRNRELSVPYEQGNNEEDIKDKRDPAEK